MSDATDWRRERIRALTQQVDALGTQVECSKLQWLSPEADDVIREVYASLHHITNKLAELEEGDPPEGSVNAYLQPILAEVRNLAGIKTTLPPEGLEDAVRNVFNSHGAQYAMDRDAITSFVDDIIAAVQGWAEGHLEHCENESKPLRKQILKLQAENDALEEHISELSRELLHASYHIEAVTCSTTTDKDVEKARKFMRKIDGDIMISVPKEADNDLLTDNDALKKQVEELKIKWACSNSKVRRLNLLLPYVSNEAIKKDCRCMKPTHTDDICDACEAGIVLDECDELKEADDA